MIPKFRGLSIDEDSKGKMQYGYLIEDNGQAFIINEVIEANEQYITIGSWYPVRPDTVSQSTGLRDKNGKEIFEGDILGTKDGLLNGVVEYNRDLGMWTNSLLRYQNFERLCVVHRDREIIGNIWEDGDLLDNKKADED